MTASPPTVRPFLAVAGTEGRPIRAMEEAANRPPRKHFPIVAIGAGDAGEPVVTVMFPEDD